MRESVIERLRYRKRKSVCQVEIEREKRESECVRESLRECVR